MVVLVVVVAVKFSRNFHATNATISCQIIFDAAPTKEDQARGSATETEIYLAGGRTKDEVGHILNFVGK